MDVAERAGLELDHDGWRRFAGLSDNRALADNTIDGYHRAVTRRQGA
jgi:hypothetical protein